MCSWVLVRLRVGRHPIQSIMLLGCSPFWWWRRRGNCLWNPFASFRSSGVLVPPLCSSMTCRPTMIVRRGIVIIITPFLGCIFIACLLRDADRSRTLSSCLRAFPAMLFLVPIRFPACLPRGLLLTVVFPLRNLCRRRFCLWREFARGEVGSGHRTDQLFSGSWIVICLSSRRACLVLMLERVRP